MVYVNSNGYNEPVMIGDQSKCNEITKYFYTVKPVLSGHPKIDKMKVLETGGSLMQV